MSALQRELATVVGGEQLIAPNRTLLHHGIVQVSVRVL
jgi:hypothetical protein